MAYSNYCLVCGGTGCESSKSDQIYRELRRVAEERGVDSDVQIVKTGCFGFCEKGPIVKMLPDESFYVDVKPDDVLVLVDKLHGGECGVGGDDDLVAFGLANAADQHHADDQNHY